MLLRIIDATTFEHEGICVPRSSPVICTKTDLNFDISSLGVSPLLCQCALNKNNDNACILIECHGTECRFRKRTRLPILFRDRIMPVCPPIVASPQRRRKACSSCKNPTAIILSTLIQYPIALLWIVMHCGRRSIPSSYQALCRPCKGT